MFILLERVSQQSQHALTVALAREKGKKMWVTEWLERLAKVYPGARAEGKGGPEMAVGSITAV